MNILAISAPPLSPGLGSSFYADRSDEAALAVIVPQPKVVGVVKKRIIRGGQFTSNLATAVAQFTSN